MRIALTVLMPLVLGVGGAQAQVAWTRPAVTLWGGGTGTIYSHESLGGPGLGISGELPVTKSAQVRIDAGRAFWDDGDLRRVTASLMFRHKPLQFVYLGVGYGVYDSDYASRLGMTARFGGGHFTAGIDSDSPGMTFAAEINIRLVDGAMAPYVSQYGGFAADVMFGVKRRF